MNKRKFLALAGGGVLVAAGGAAWAMASTRRSVAVAPWKDAGLFEDPRHRALSYAVLAPSAQNMQPWLVDLGVPDEISLHADPSRLLTSADPFGRQTMIGLGCFLEILVMAAAQDGTRAEIELSPTAQGNAPVDGGEVARVRLVADPATPRDPLFAHVLGRRTTKEPFDPARPVPDEVLAALTGAVSHGAAAAATNDANRVARLRALTAEALVVEMQTPAYEESVGHYRLGRHELEASPDGIPFDGLFFEALVLIGQFSREQALDRSSTVFTSGRDKQVATAETAMGHVWLTTRGNSRADQIAAGHDWVRVALAATAAGVAIHPLSQALEEMPEMAGPYRAVHAMLAPDGATVQMLARLGYGDPASPTPRWPLERKIIGTLA